MQENTFLSIIIPAYNEASNIGATLAEVAEYLKGKDYSYEVIVIDDGSSDDTISTAKEKKNDLNSLRIISSKPNRGKGYVVREAMLDSSGKYVMFMDADNSTSIKELDAFLPYLEEGYDAVIGSRRLKESDVVVPESIMRVCLGNIYILLSKIFLGSKVSDFNCGFKAYNRCTARKVFSLQRMKDWSFDTEIIFLLTKFGMKIKEVPVRWAHKADSKVKPLQAGIASFLSLIKIKINDLRGLYQ